MRPTINPPATVQIPFLQRASRRGEPTWEVALVFPAQGEWTEEDYLALHTNRIVELSDGCLEVHHEECDPTPPTRSQRGAPAWEVALLLPFQGEWTEADYLALNTNHLIELSDGCLELLPMPTIFHQLILQFLFGLLDAHVKAQLLGRVLLAPLPVRLWPGKIREPDIAFFRPERIRNLRGQPEGADLAMEVVSEGAENRKRDVETKREEYARAGIAEYWIVDPQEQQITVLALDGQTYRTHGVFGLGTTATSVLLPGFTVAVDAVFAAGQGLPTE
jgi:Uma2 family endonuclease